MKRTLTSISAFALLVPLIFFQAKSASSLIHREPQANTAADKAWPEFFAALRVAVQKRDRSALREMMKAEFIYDCCDNMDENNNGETRDEAFRRWDKFPK